MLGRCAHAAACRQAAAARCHLAGGCACACGCPPARPGVAQEQCAEPPSPWRRSFPKTRPLNRLRQDGSRPCSRRGWPRLAGRPPGEWCRRCRARRRARPAGRQSSPRAAASPRGSAAVGGAHGRECESARAGRGHAVGQRAPGLAVLRAVAQAAATSAKLQGSTRPQRPKLRTQRAKFRTKPSAETATAGNA